MSAQLTNARPPTARRTTRAVAAGLATLGALTVWVVADPLLGIDFSVTQSGTTTVVGPGSIIGSALAASLLGWALLAVLERYTPRARRAWVTSAVVVLLLSLVVPFIAGEIETGAQMSLLAMHLVVGAVLIPVYARSSRDLRHR